MENYNDENHMNEFETINSLCFFPQAGISILSQPAPQVKVHELFLPICSALLL